MLGVEFFPDLVFVSNDACAEGAGSRYEPSNDEENEGQGDEMARCEGNFSLQGRDPPDLFWKELVSYVKRVFNLGKGGLIKVI